jgi:PAS domain S-box-containing protein
VLGARARVYGQTLSVIEPSLIDEEDVAVVVADDERRYVHANAAACSLFGIEHDDLIGMRVEEITGTPPAEVEASWGRLRDAGVLVDTFPLRSPVGVRRIPYIAVADVTPGRHLAILIPTRGDGGWQPLSRRERQVVTLVAGGATGREVGEALSVTAATVETHIRNAMRRLGARNRSHLVTLAILRHEIEVGDVGAWTV